MRAIKFGGANQSASGSADTGGTAIRRSRVARRVALLLGLTFVLVPASVAHADTPTSESSTNLNMKCTGYTGKGEEVQLYVIRRSEEPAPLAELYLTSADGEDQQAWTSTDAVIGDGAVSATIPLGGGDDVIVAGTYRAVADPVTLRQRFRIENSVVISTVVHQPFAVQLTTSDLGSIGPVDLACDVESLEQSSQWSNPHRVVMRTQQPAVVLDGDCAAGTVTSVELQASEGEYTLIARTADAFGYGFVTPNGGTGEIAWFDPTDPDVALSVQPARLSMRQAGAPSVTTTADGTTTTVVRTTPQHVRLTFGLPDGGSYDVTCGGRSITQNFSTADTGR